MSETAPQFSVVLPVYDRQQPAERAIDSVLGQSFGDLELIVVDDGSPEPFRLSEAHRLDGRVRLLRHMENRGPAAARNSGAAKAAGEWIAWIDSDDRWHEHKLQRQAEVVARMPPSAMAAIATGFRYVGEGRQQSRIPIAATSPELFFSGCWFCPGTTTVVSRQAFGRVGGYDETLRRFEDVDWFIRFGLAGGRLHVVNEVLVEIKRGPAPPLSLAGPAARILVSKVEQLAPERRQQLRMLKAFLHLALAASARREGRPVMFAWRLARSLALQPRLRPQLSDFWRSPSGPVHLG